MSDPVVLIRIKKLRDTGEAEGSIEAGADILAGRLEDRESAMAFHLWDDYERDNPIEMTSNPTRAGSVGQDLGNLPRTFSFRVRLNQMGENVGRPAGGKSLVQQDDQSMKSQVAFLERIRGARVSVTATNSGLSVQDARVRDTRIRGDPQFPDDRSFAEVEVREHLVTQEGGFELGETITLPGPTGTRDDGQDDVPTERRFLSSDELAAWGGVPGGGPEICKKAPSSFDRAAAIAKRAPGRNWENFKSALASSRDTIVGSLERLDDVTARDTETAIEEAQPLGRVSSTWSNEGQKFIQLDEFRRELGDPSPREIIRQVGVGPGTYFFQGERPSDIGDLYVRVEQLIEATDLEEHDFGDC